MSTSTERREIYSSRRWRKLRSEKLDSMPLCELCQADGFTVSATIVHHKVHIRQGGPAFPDDLDQLQSLCQPCHDDIHRGDGKQCLSGDRLKFYQRVIQTEGSK